MGNTCLDNSTKTNSIHEYASNNTSQKSESKAFSYLSRPNKDDSFLDDESVYSSYNSFRTSDERELLDYMSYCQPVRAANNNPPASMNCPEMKNIPDLSKQLARKYRPMLISKNPIKMIGPILYSNESSTYEGEYKSSQRTGYGECHFNDGACYLGQWKGDKRHGRGLFIFKKGINFYFGDFENDLPNGKGEYHCQSLNLVYKGQYEMGMRSGNGELKL